MKKAQRRGGNSKIGEAGKPVNKCTVLVDSELTPKSAVGSHEATHFILWSPVKVPKQVPLDVRIKKGI